MRKPIESRIKRSAATAKRSAVKAKERVLKTTKDLDRKILDKANQSLEKFRSQIEVKTKIDMKGDIAKQLGRRILDKASKIKDSLTAEELKKISRRTGQSMVAKAKQNSPLSKSKKKRPRVTKRPVKH